MFWRPGGGGGGSHRPSLAPCRWLLAAAPQPIARRARLAVCRPCAGPRSRRGAGRGKSLDAPPSLASSGRLRRRVPNALASCRSGTASLLSCPRRGVSGATDPRTRRAALLRATAGANRQARKSGPAAQHRQKAGAGAKPCRHFTLYGRVPHRPGFHSARTSLHSTPVGWVLFLPGVKRRQGSLAPRFPCPVTRCASCAPCSPLPAAKIPPPVPPGGKRMLASAWPAGGRRQIKQTVVL